MKRQAAAPPLYPRRASGQDRVAGDVALLDVPPELEALMRQDALVVGEVGDRKPDAYTVRPAAGEHLVVMTSGMIDFLAAVTTTMSGLIIVWNPDGTAHNRQAASKAETFDRLRDLFQDWRRHVEPGFLEMFRRRDRITADAIGADQRALSLSEAQLLGAEHFLIAHELAHVAMNMGAIAEPDPNDEVSADAVGLRFYLERAKAALGTRQALAGAALALRVLVALQHGGARFTAAYPLQQDRLARWIEALRATYPSDQHFEEEATVMVANFDLFDDLDEQAGPPKAPPPPWRARAGMIAVTEAIAIQGHAAERFAGMFREWLSTTSQDTMREVIHRLLDYYPGTPAQPSFHSYRVRRVIGQALRSCIATLTDDERAALALDGQSLRA